MLPEVPAATIRGSVRHQRSLVAGLSIALNRLMEFGLLGIATGSVRVLLAFAAIPVKFLPVFEGVRDFIRGRTKIINGSPKNRIYCL